MKVYLNVSGSKQLSRRIRGLGRNGDHNVVSTSQCDLHGPHMQTHSRTHHNRFAWQVWLTAGLLHTSKFCCELAILEGVADERASHAFI